MIETKKQSLYSPLGALPFHTELQHITDAQSQLPLQYTPMVKSFPPCLCRMWQ